MEEPAALRARLGYPPDRACATVGGQRIRGAQLSCTLQGFGDFRWADAAGLPRTDYTAEVPVALLLEMMEREHPDYVADALAHPDPGDAYEQAQRERGWPPPARMLEDPVLLPMTLEHYAHDLMVHWFGDGQPPEVPGWVAHGITRHARVDGTVLLEGTALPAGR
ncbi:hypothetical protein [Longimicrobium sp.]|uniref:hypothetical protein n=1 Tax=Longimicrobium sp. TaxID=2029185 RepID=UPI003B3BAAA3